MTAIRGALPAILLLVMGAPAFAGPGRAIPCRPPLDTPLRLSVNQHIWLADGTPATATVTRRLRFVRDGGGLVVEAEISALETDQQGDARARMLIAYGTPGEVRTRVRLDATMAIKAVESLDALWQDFRERQARLDAAMRQHGKVNARTDAMLHALDAMDETQRTAVLTTFLNPVLQYCGTVVPTDAVAARDGALHIESRADSPGVSDVGAYDLDGRTGLLLRLDRSITLANVPLRPLRELWTLEAE